MIQKVQRTVEVPHIQYAERAMVVPLRVTAPDPRTVEVPMIQKIQRTVEVPHRRHEERAMVVPRKAAAPDPTTTTTTTTTTSITTTVTFQYAVCVPDVLPIRQQRQQR